MLSPDAYLEPAPTSESKKPSRNDRANCLKSMVGRDRFELSTYGLRVRKNRLLFALIGNQKKA
jgi:hypothetical protein